jgi:hypothetical protein
MAIKAKKTVTVEDSTTKTPSGGMTNEQRLDMAISNYFPPSVADIEFVGPKATPLGSLKFRKASYENNNSNDIMYNPDAFNSLVFYVDPKTKEVTSVNVVVGKDELGKIHLGLKTPEDFADEYRGKASHFDYALSAGSIILKRRLGLDEEASWPKAEEFQKLIEANLVSGKTGLKMIQISRKYHMKNNAQEKRRLKNLNKAMSRKSLHETL